MTNKQRGFTLLEVMVAVAILALALSALVKMTGETSNTLSYLEKKTYGQWVANNQINEIKIEGTWPRVGKINGKTEMAGIDWNWEVETKGTEVDGFRRLDVSVMQGDDDNSIYRLSSFIAKPTSKTIR